MSLTINNGFIPLQTPDFNRASDSTQNSVNGNNKDNLSISGDGKYFSRLLSGVATLNQNIKELKSVFDFRITSDNSFSYSLNSFELSKSSNMSLKINSTFQQTIRHGDSPELKTYSSVLEIKWDKLYDVREKKKVEKEDIMLFLNRFFSKIFQALADVKNRGRKIVIDPEDLKEILGLDDKKLKGFVLQFLAWINSIQNSNRGVITDNKNQKDVLIKVGRVTEDILEKETTTTEKFSINFKMEEIVTPAKQNESV